MKTLIGIVQECEYCEDILIRGKDAYVDGPHMSTAGEYWYHYDGDGEYVPCEANALLEEWYARNKWCKCDEPNEVESGKGYVCKICSSPIVCDICYDDEKGVSQATILFDTYWFVCKEHEATVLERYL